MAEAQSALGSYLLTKRMERSGDSIPDYLARYSAAGPNGVISESYYRDIESGRKQLRPQTADRLRDQLDLDKRSFYYYLLRDLIPEDVFDTLVSPSAVETYRSVSDRIQKLEQKAQQSARVVLNSMVDDVTELETSEIDALQRDPCLLGVLHFIYNRASASFEEIDSVYRKCGGAEAISDQLSSTFNKGTIYINAHERRAYRRSRTIKVPRTKQGKAFKDNFVEAETEKSLSRHRISRLSDGPGTLSYSTIVPIPRQLYHEIELDGVSRLMSIIESADTSLEHDDVSPFFVSIILSSREEYDVTKPTEGVSNDRFVSH